MAPEEFRAAREQLRLSADGMARKLRMSRWGERTVRRWESGESPISGVVEVAIELLLEKAATDPVGAALDEARDCA
jgi:DNA-binding transcriptional regulator YiaG